MPHITLKQGLPGIRGPMVFFSPETTKPLCDLVEVLPHRAAHPDHRRARNDRDLRLFPKRFATSASTPTAPSSRNTSAATPPTTNLSTP
jgi:hypothetical protein